MQERGLSAYLAELIGTLLLVFFITSVFVLFVSTGSQAQFGSDFAVVGLAEGLALFAVLAMFWAVSGGHFNPAITIAAAALRRISPIDAVIYIFAQLIGAVIGAQITKWLLEDEGRATNYAAGQVSGLLANNFAGAVVEGIGVFVLVLVFMSVFLSKRGVREWGTLGVGFTFAFLVMVIGPLTVACLNPARWFGSAVVANEWGDVWPFVVGPLVGALLAVAVFRFIIEAGDGGKAPGGTPARGKDSPASAA